MKRRISLLWMLLVGAVFTSCEPNEEPGDNNMNAEQVVEGSPCEFLPIEVGNYWVYDNLFFNTIDSAKVTGEEAFGGKMWKILNGNTYVYCDENAHYQWEEDFDEDSFEPNVEAAFRILIKDPALGQSWTDLYEFEFGSRLTMNYEVVAVDATLQLSEASYDNVVQVEGNFITENPGEPDIHTKATRWFVKNVGVIKTEVITEGDTLITELLDHGTL